MKLNSISPAKFTEFNNLIQELDINTICNSGLCPNRPECFKKKRLTFLILGETCTRNCKFCAVSKGNPKPINAKEPKNIANATKKLNLKYVVITSVTRDDLPDGGAQQFVNTLNKIRELNPEVDIEILIPDFKFNFKSINKIIASKPKVINHNIECCKKCFKKIRPMGNYKGSLQILRYIKKKNKNMITKSGFMIGVGESMNDIKETLKNLKENHVDIITVGQYLAPTKKSFKIKKIYAKEEFDKIRKYALKLGFKSVIVGSKVRSSYNAEQQFI